MYAYKKLIKLYGNKSAIACAFGISRQAILNWSKNGVPIKYARSINKITRGVVTMSDVMRG